ncbi:GTPase HflX [Candidatus Gracilibacteria bacterium]|nr:GTPase HflX [Candidatus Gracilibacteria bacterium]
MRTILLDIAPKDSTLLAGYSLDDRVAELEKLVSTYRGIVVLQTLQKRDEPDYTTYVGKGKLDEVLNLSIELKADVLIIGNILKPRQVFAIIQEIEKRKLKIQVWDRVDLILKIFQLHAKTPEAKLQIQLASLKHMGPRIFGMGMELDRQGGGGGAANKGIGETNTEIMKRHLREMERKTKEKINHYRKVRVQNRLGRKRMNATTVGIVGYTNAGKSTLMNALTDKGVYEKDELFATLGTTVGRLKLPQSAYRDEEGNFKSRTDILIYDTIGFIRDLPPELVDAFSSTLEESLSCDLLLQVVDASDPHIIDRIAVTDEILTRIGATQPRWYVFNQTDKCTPAQIKKLKTTYKHLKPLFVSAKTNEGLEELKAKILTFSQ